MTTPPRVWDGVLRRLGAELPELVVASFFAPVVAADEAPGAELRLLCPTVFHRDRLRDRFLPLLERCASAEAGRELRVSLFVAPPAASTGASPAVAAGRSPDRRGAVAAEPAPAPSPGGPARGPVPATSGRSGAPPRRPGATPPRLQAELPYTFDSFVVGACNALAREASLAVAEDRQRLLNPLYLVAEPGLGKTHLSRAILAEAAAGGGTRVLYTSAEQFTGAFTSALRRGQMDRFKRRFRSGCDLLVVEDVQFLGGKVKTQLELFHTLTHLMDANARVVLTGDQLPRDIARLDERLASQMAAGFVAELEPPDARVRRQILRAKAAAGGVKLPDECLDLLVESLRGNVRDLVGVLIQLVESAALLKRPIDAELTHFALRKVAPEPQRPAPLSIEQVIDVVCSFSGVGREAMASRSRRREHTVPRQLAMYLCRRYSEQPLGAIAAAFDRHHPSVRNAEQVVERAILERAPLRYKVEELVARLDRLRG